MEAALRVEEDTTVPFQPHEEGYIIELGGGEKDEDRRIKPSSVLRCREQEHQQEQDDVRESTGDAGYPSRHHDSGEEEEGEDDAHGRHFQMTKPWVGNLQPPTNFDPKSINARAPEVTLQLDYVYGYRTRQARDNVHWVDEPNVILYHAASVCVVADVHTRTQRYYQGHTDDVMSLTYNRTKRLAASGGLGKRNTAPIHVWSVDTLEPVVVITGFLEFAVLSVAFSTDASRIMAIGADTYHTVAIFDVNTGIMVGSSKGDSNKVFHCIADSSLGNDTKRHFVSIGISHIKFWSKEKGKELLVGKKAIGGNIAAQTMMSAACTDRYVCVGNVAGELYILSGGKLVKTVKAHTSHCGGLGVENNVLYSGGRDGLIKRWNLTDLDIKQKMTATVTTTYDLNSYSALSHPNRYVKNPKDKLLNGARALSVSNGKVLTGTRLSSIYILPNEVEVTTVLECHFDADPNFFHELWGLDIHPKEPLFCTAGDDATLRLWSLDLGTMILMAPIVYPSRACAFSADGTMIAVGHQNGAFSVWDAMTLTPIVPFTRKRAHRVQHMCFSPCGRYLAMSMGQANLIDVYYVKRNFEFIGFCDAFSSNIKRIDWNLDGDVFQCCTAAYEMLHFNIPSCEPNQSPEMCDEEWHTYCCFIAWGAQGLWEDCNDGTDINSAGRSNSRKYIVGGYDNTRIRIYNYPCLPKSVESTGQAVFPEHRSFHGHSSHVTGVHFSADDAYVITAGGMDQTVLRWKVVPVGEAPPSPERPRPTTAEAPQDITMDIARGRIRELGESAGGSRRRVDEEKYEDGAQPLRGNRRAPTPSEKPAHRLKTTTRRPGSSTHTGRGAVESRLLNATASMASKLAHGRAQRAHILQQEQARKRFNNF